MPDQLRTSSATGPLGSRSLSMIEVTDSNGTEHLNAFLLLLHQHGDV